MDIDLSSPPASTPTSAKPPSCAPSRACRRGAWGCASALNGKRGQCNDHDEQLLVYSVVLALLYERQQLKDLFEA